MAVTGFKVSNVELSNVKDSLGLIDLFKRKYRGLEFIGLTPLEVIMKKTGHKIPDNVVFIPNIRSVVPKSTMRSYKKK
jgi:hypothetical protein